MLRRAGVTQHVSRPLASCGCRAARYDALPRVDGARETMAGACSKSRLKNFSFSIAFPSGAGKR